MSNYLDKTLSATSLVIFGCVFSMALAGCSISNNLKTSLEPAIYFSLYLYSFCLGFGVILTAALVIALVRFLVKRERGSWLLTPGELLLSLFLAAPFFLFVRGLFIWRLSGRRYFGGYLEDLVIEAIAVGVGVGIGVLIIFYLRKLNRLYS